MMMNKMKAIPYGLFLLILTLSGCRKVEKNVQDYYPTVTTTSAQVQTDGTVIVNASILSEGADPVKYAGFCMDTIPEPYMLSNQQTVDSVFDGSFRTTYRDLKPATKYYFRSFVANANGYACGNVVSVDNAIFDTTMIDCHPGPNFIHMEGSSSSSYTSTFSSVEPLHSNGPSDWELDADTYEGYTIHIKMADYPIQGAYKTSGATLSTGGGKYINVSILGPITDFGQVLLEENTNVYIRIIDSKHIEFRFCDAVLKWNGTRKITARFIATN